ncbi:MAG: glycosyltransferase [Cytophagales bacterium]|nr:glycosyltransferase [Armatimonadota bacterium]
MSETTDSTSATHPDAEGEDYGIIVHCHLRWDFVWQRPQHLMNRLSKHHPILFLEDPAPLPGDTDSDHQPRLQLTHVSETLTVARPLLLPHVGDPVQDAETDKLNAPAWRRLLDTLVHQLQQKDPGHWGRIVHWIYSPMAAPSRNLYNPVAVVYDCMDELANFKGAPEGLKQKESDLMAAADVIFTGGPSMYAARKDLYPDKVYQFNSGVDVEHFRKALDPATTAPDDAANLSHPVLLYYGVIDERMGWENLAAVCDAHPEWSVLMVGPLAKITEEDLLRRPNLHYTGQRGYEDLPRYLKAADVTLVPFALSDATRYLSPTKTLEYYAARRPVVSTPIQDIVDNYADAARIAHTPGEFVLACEAALAEDNTARLAAGERHAEAQTWDNIVARMHEILDAAVANKGRIAVSEATSHGNSPELGGAAMATGQVRWYSGSRGAGVVDMEGGEEVLGFLPGEAQNDLGGVREGDSIAVGAAIPSSATPAGPSHIGRNESSANLFPMGLDKILKGEDKE